MKIAIASGGNLGDWAVEELAAADYRIGADRGALFLLQSGLRVDAALGDFDSVDPDEKAQIALASQQFIDCDPVLKDLTDTEMALRHALDLNPDELVIVGGLGSRFDHSLANVYLLKQVLDRGVTARVIDASNEVSLVRSELTIQRQHYTHVSLLPLTSEVHGITLEGFKYPLVDATLAHGISLGVSNELFGEQGRILVKSGILIVIQSRDT